MENTCSLLQPPGSVRQAVSDFLRYCRARNLSPSTLHVNQILLSRLNESVGDLPPAHLTPEHLRTFLTQIGQNCSPSTVQRYRQVLCSFGKYLKTLWGLPNPADALERPKAPRPVIEPLSPQEVVAMITACPSTPTGKRDRLLLLTLVDCGLRASELAALHVEDVDLTEHVLLVRRGKGGKPRRVPFGQTVATALTEWMALRRNVKDPHLFVTCFGRPLDRNRVRAIVIQAARRAGITRKVGPHRLRHTCAVSYLRAGGDVFTLQRFLGHADLTMTRRYTAVADTDVQEKHRLYSPADRLQLPTPRRNRVL